MSDEIKPTLTPLTRASLFQFKPRTRTVALPDFGSTAIVRELRASETAEFVKRQAKAGNEAAYYLIKTAVVDADGASLFAGATDAELDAMPTTAGELLVAAITDLSFPKPATPQKSPPAAG